MEPIKLTVQGIAGAIRPAGKSQAFIPFADPRGLYLRIRGRKRGDDQKTLVVPYRAGGGRAGQQRWHKIADADAISPKAAREAALIVLGRIAKGEDPAGERKASKKADRQRLEAALDTYEADLKQRHVVKRGEYLSLLRRELRAPLGNIDLRELDRATVAERVRKIKESGRPGAAKELKTRANVFLGWCVDEGLINANPLAGWRQKRRTRAERLDRPGRALADREIPILWRAAAAEGWPFGPYLQMLLLLGQRRTETALMKWSDLKLEAGIWTVPAEITKSGREHRVPLPPQAVAILKALPRMARSDFVFPGHRGAAMTGWSKRLPPVYGATTKAGMAHWTPHDLRRTMRSGLGRLGVDQTIAELLLNHAISDELRAIYDREEYQVKRAEAAGRWADHVLGLVEGKSVEVVQLRAAH